MDCHNNGEFHCIVGGELVGIYEAIYDLEQWRREQNQKEILKRDALEIIKGSISSIISPFRFDGNYLESSSLNLYKKLKDFFEEIK
jgi:hypothetical protein